MGQFVEATMHLCLSCLSLSVALIFGQAQRTRLRNVPNSEEPSITVFLTSDTRRHYAPVTAVGLAQSER